MRGRVRSLLKPLAVAAAIVGAAAGVALGVIPRRNPPPVFSPHPATLPQVKPDLLRTAASSEAAATEGLDALLRDYRTDHGLLKGSHIFQQYAWPWEQSQVAAAAYQTALATGTPAALAREQYLLDEVPQYWHPGPVSWNPGSPPGFASARDWSNDSPTMYYDDNGWLGMELMDGHDLTQNPADLQRAIATLRFIASGWDNNAGEPPRGGVYWGMPARLHQRNTITNGLAINLALRIYQATHQQYYLDFAKKTYGWMNHSLLRRDGFYNDQIDTSGHAISFFIDYDEGIMIGANLRFFEVTKDPVYLERAEYLAQKTIAYFGTTGLERQETVFGAIFIRFLGQLYNVSPRPEYLDAMRRYEAYINRYTDSRGVFKGGGVEILDRAGAIQVHAAVALAEQKAARLLA